MVLGGYVFYVTAPSELLMTADSGYYATVAEALRKHQGFSHHGRYWTVFPPLYPLILSLSGPSLTPIQFAPILHAALFGLLLFTVSIQQGYQNARTLPINLIFPLLALVSPVFGVASYIWTEELYIVLTTLMFLLLWRHPSSVSWVWLLPLGLVTSLAPITRYIGIVNVVTATTFLFFIFTGRWWVKILKCVAFALVTATPLATWCYRNYAIDGTLFGIRPPRSSPISQNLAQSWLTFSSWFETVGEARVSILWLVIPTLLYATIRVRAFIPWKKCAPLILFIGAYLAFLNVSASMHVHDPIDTRLLVPLYVPLVFLLGCVTQTTLSFGSRITQTVILSALALITLSNALIFGKVYYDLPLHRHELICRHNSFPPPSANCPAR
jgi:hypothetical protein